MYNEMCDTVQDALRDIFPSFVSDMIYQMYVEVYKEDIHDDIVKIAPHWITLKSFSAFHYNPTYTKCGIMAYKICRTLNNHLKVNPRKRRTFSTIYVGPPSNFHVQDYHEEHDCPLFPRKTDLTYKYYSRKRKHGYPCEIDSARGYRLTKKILIEYLTENGIPSRGLSSKKNEDLWKLTMTF